MSFADKQKYKELFKLYIYSLDIKQINYPLILGLIYHEIHGSTILEPEYLKISNALIKSIREWNDFIINFRKRETQEKYILSTRSNIMKPIRLNAIS